MAGNSVLYCTAMIWGGQLAWHHACGFDSSLKQFMPVPVCDQSGHSLTSSTAATRPATLLPIASASEAAMEVVPAPAASAAIPVSSATASSCRIPVSTLGSRRGRCRMQNLEDGSFTATADQYPLESSSEIGSTKPNRNLMRQRKHAASNEIAIQRHPSY